MGNIFAIKRFEIHDGDGIRTTVFLKGCPLRCQWCHNPEGLESAPILSYYPSRCAGCGMCARVCGAHAVENGAHTFHRAACAACGRCEGACAHGALTLYGRETSVEALLPQLLEDRAFYRNGGGVTLSGGEPMMQPAFALSLLRALKGEGVNTALDTSGFAPREHYERALSCADTFLFDVKALDPDVHEALTGQKNGRILDNLRFLHDAGAAIEVRVPYIPGMNDGEMEPIGRHLAALPRLRGVRILGYHNLAIDKYASLGLPYAMGDARMPDASALLAVENRFRALGIPIARD